MMLRKITSPVGTIWVLRVGFDSRKESEGEGASGRGILRWRSSACRMRRDGGWQPGPGAFSPGMHPPSAITVTIRLHFILHLIQPKAYAIYTEDHNIIPNETFVLEALLLFYGNHLILYAFKLCLV